MKTATAALAAESARLNARPWDTVSAGIPADHPRCEVAAPPDPRTAAQPQVVTALPFTASSHEHTEPAFDVTATPGAARVPFNNLDVPAHGYFRHLFIEVVASGGAGGTGNADYPWNILQDITLQDVGGANIVGPIDGYALYLCNLIGGYASRSDLASALTNPDFVAGAPNPSFTVRVPVEISAADALGALANQNASANFKFGFSVATRAETMSVDYTTAPSFRIRGWLEAWTLPAARDGRGRPQSQTPPMLGVGQVISSRVQNGIGVGENTVQLKRVGNLLRFVLLIARSGAGARADNVFPDPMRFTWDGITIHHTSQRYWRQYLSERLTGWTRQAGVFALPFNHGGRAGNQFGNETPDLWLPTVQSSRLEVVGNSAAAGAVQVVTCEVTGTETNQVERWQVPNDSAFQPRT